MHLYSFALGSSCVICSYLIVPYAAERLQSSREDQQKLMQNFFDYF